MILQDESNKIERGSINSEIDEERTNLSRVNLEVTEKIKPSNYLQCSCDELKIRQRDLKREKQKILRCLFVLNSSQNICLVPNCCQVGLVFL